MSLRYRARSNWRHSRKVDEERNRTCTPAESTTYLVSTEYQVRSVAIVRPAKATPKAPTKTASRVIKMPTSGESNKKTDAAGKIRLITPTSGIPTSASTANTRG